MKTKYVLIITALFFATAITSVFAQPDWARVNYETSTVFTGYVKVNGLNADVNDMVAVFVNNECRMVSRIVMHNDSSYVSAVIHSVGTPEQAVIKYWDSHTNTVHTLDTMVTISNHGTVKRFPIEIKSEQIPDDPTDVVVVGNTLEIYPSPFTNTIQIESSKPISSVQIFNSIGSKMFAKKANGSLQVSIDGSELSAGMYLVSIEFNDGTIQTKKVFKK